MKFPKYQRVTSLVVVLLFLSVSAFAGKPKKNESAAKLVDSGVFGVYVNGKRMASEKFEISQTPEYSLLKSEFKLEEAKNPQNAELRLSPSGDLQRYEWSEKDQGTAVVEPKDEFLIEKVTINQGKSTEQPFILPTSTLILDDYFFSQRQLLLWRYLAGQCRPKPGEAGCQLTPTKFGVIIPRAQMSSQVTISYAGQQKLAIKGVDRELSRFDLHMEENDWIVWVDESYKIQKIAIEAERTEIYRD
ncbi:MAG TPA: hypothetical protein VN577_17225 [Terriglobales bacterium]|nr:hypothetical protein [Terriglobales bacterium]